MKREAADSDPAIKQAKTENRIQESDTGFCVLKGTAIHRPNVPKSPPNPSRNNSKASGKFLYDFPKTNPLYPTYTPAIAIGVSIVAGNRPTSISNIR